MHPTPRQSGLLARLSAIPLWAVFLLVLAVFLGGLFTTGPVSVLLLAAVLALMGALARVQWPILPAPQRAVRLLAMTAVAALAAYKLVASW